MKSRYEPLVKLKKQALDKTEQQLLNANTEVTLSDTALRNAYAQLSTFESPSNGPIGELLQAQMILQAHHREIETCRLRVERAGMNQHAAREAFRLSRIEFEKFNYLEVQEVEAMMAKAKQEEAKMLDEIGTITYKKVWL
ncbi:MAG: flagellar FliJ family protein [Sulfuricurvum sp.]|nr:flagellar FliJ family protein [Sulfuricurvum sp.]